MRVLLIHDVERQGVGKDGKLRWAYAHRTAALQKHAPPDVHCDRMSEPSFRATQCSRWDVIFLLDYMQLGGFMKQIMKATRGRKRPVVVCSFNKDANSRREFFDLACSRADWVIINNRHRYDTPGSEPHTNICCISNGVDLDDWHITTPIHERPHKVLWCGSTGVSKGKGWEEILKPLRRELEGEFEFDYRPINDITPKLVWPTKKQNAWYNSGSYYLNASTTEGTPSAALESMAAGCVYVSTEIGNVREFGVNGQNCVLADRTVDSFVASLRKARDDRERISAYGHHTMTTRWGYDPEHGNRAAYFWNLFRALHERGPGGVIRFSYDEIEPGEI